MAGSSVESSQPYTVKKISRAAQLIDDYTTEAKSKNLIWAVTECDITKIQELFKQYKEKTGETISMTAFIITVFAHVIEMHKFPINTMRKRRNKFYIFDEVDVMTNIEREIDGIKKPVNYTIRRANYKTLREIQDELQAARTTKKVELSSSRTGAGKKIITVMPYLPRFFRRLILRYVFNDPILKKKFLGTVGVTAVGMFGKGEIGNQFYERGGNGHMIHLTPHTLSLGVGGIDDHPYTELPSGEIVNHTWLDLTLAMDHAIIDGGPATRFFRDLRGFLETNCIDEPWCFKSLSEKTVKN